MAVPEIEIFLLITSKMRYRLVRRFLISVVDFKLKHIVHLPFYRTSSVIY